MGGYNTVVLSPLDAHKDHELVIISEDMGNDFVNAVALVYETYKTKLGVFCFSSSYALPLTEEQRKNEKYNSLPVMVKFGSRGNCQSVLSDVSSLELYALYNVNTNPYSTISAFHETLTKKL